MTATIPLGRLGLPTDLAAAVAFLGRTGRQLDHRTDPAGQRRSGLKRPPLPSAHQLERSTRGRSVTTATTGTMMVDWEARADMHRLREDRLARLRAEVGAQRTRRRLGLRLREHPLHDRHPHRHLGGGQAHSVLVADARSASDRLVRGPSGRAARRAGPRMDPAHGRPQRRAPHPRRDDARPGGERLRRRPRLRQGAEAVRQADRLLPGAPAPPRRHRHRARGSPADDLLRRSPGRRRPGQDAPARSLDGEALRHRGGPARRARRACR